MPHLREATSGQCWAGFGLTLTVSKTDELRANIRLAGDLDIASARLMVAALEHELDLGRRYVRLDMSGLSFVDSHGIAALVETHWRFLERRGTVVIIGAPRRARRLMELTGTDTVLLVAAELAAPAAVPVA
jgi:anti-sigma B factor antagonist